MLGDFDHDVIGILPACRRKRDNPCRQAGHEVRILTPLANRRHATCRALLSFPLPCGSAFGSKCPGAITASVPASPQQRSFFSIFCWSAVTISALTVFNGSCSLHRAVAGIVVHVARAADAFQPDVLFHQVFVDVEMPATGEYLVELVSLQLVHAGPAETTTVLMSR